jgi:hypothetical protein
VSALATSGAGQANVDLAGIFVWPGLKKVLQRVAVIVMENISVATTPSHEILVKAIKQEVQQTIEVAQKVAQRLNSENFPGSSLFIIFFSPSMYEPLFPSHGQQNLMDNRYGHMPQLR